MNSLTTPQMTDVKKEKKSVKKDTFFCARSKSTDEYVYFGEISGYTSLEKTDDYHNAYKAFSPHALMSSLGGHYKGYECVEFKRKVVENGVKKWPKESEVFDD